MHYGDNIKLLDCFGERKLLRLGFRSKDSKYPRGDAET